MLPNYYCHIKNYPGSLLPKLYGAHVVKPFGGFKVSEHYNILKLAFLSTERINLVHNGYKSAKQ